MAVADEAWDLAPSIVDDGLNPVILQQSDAQLWVVSTSNPKATGLMIGRRAASLVEPLEPVTNTLWIEWSVAPAADVGDPEVGSAHVRVGHGHRAPLRRLVRLGCCPASGGSGR